MRLSALIEDLSARLFEADDEPTRIEKIFGPDRKIKQVSKARILRPLDTDPPSRVSKGTLSPRNDKEDLNRALNTVTNKRVRKVVGKAAMHRTDTDKEAKEAEVNRIDKSAILKPHQTYRGKLIDIT